MRNAASRSWACRGDELCASQRGAQPRRDGVRLAAAEQVGFERIQMGELLGARQRRVVRDVVGGADELVEGEDRRAMLRR